MYFICFIYIYIFLFVFFKKKISYFNKLLYNIFYKYGIISYFILKRLCKKKKKNEYSLLKYNYS